MEGGAELPHFLLRAHGNSNTSGEKEASLDPIMASTPPSKFVGLGSLCVSAHI